MTLAKRNRESDLEAFLVAETRRLGGEAIKQTGVAGIPDRLVLGPRGQVAWVELKRKGGAVSMLQLHMIKRLRALGHTAEIVDSKEGVRAVLRRMSWDNDDSPPFNPADWDDDDSDFSLRRG